MSGGTYGGWNFIWQSQPGTATAGAAVGSPAGTTWGDGAGFEAISNTLATEDLVPIEVPSDCMITSIDVHVRTIAGGAAQITLAIFRNSTGDVAFINDNIIGATQTIRTGMTTATQGSAAWLLNKDHHPTADSTNTSDQGIRGNQTTRLWVGFYLDAGTAVVDRIIVNGRS